MSDFLDIRSKEIIEEFLTSYIPGRGDDMQLLQKLEKTRNATLVYLGSDNSGKSNLFENTFIDLANSSANAGISDLPTPTAKDHLAVLQSFSGIQQSSINDSNRGVSVISCMFDEKNNYLGAQFSILALELFRVVKSNNIESDYFIFHDIVHCASSSLKSQLHLSRLKFLPQISSDCADKNRFEALNKVLNSFGPEYTNGSDKSLSFFKVIAAVLHLRQVEVTETESGNVEISNLDLVSELLGISTKSLQSTFGVRKINAGRRVSTAETFNTAEQTKRCIEVLTKQLYRIAVSWFLKKMNIQSMKLERQTQSTLTLVDIPGAEHSQQNTNGLHNLCRNYINECAFSSLVSSLFHKEKALLVSQGIGHLWRDVDVPPANSELITLLSQPARGLLPLLDVQTQLGEAASDKAYLSQTRMVWNGTSNFSKPRFGEDEGYVVKHFFGAVNYSVAGYIEMNTESIHKTFTNLGSMLQKSTNHVVKEVYVDNILVKGIVEEDEEEREPHPIQPMKLMDLANEQYRSDMHMASRVLSEGRLLSTALDSAEHVHWVVCCAPHERYPKNRSLNESWVRQQLQTFLVDKAVASRGYDFPHREQLGQIQRLSKETAALLDLVPKAPRILGAASRGFLLSGVLDKGDLEVGPDVVFLRPGALDKVDLFAVKIRNKAAAVIQGLARRNCARKKFTNSKRNAVAIQAVVRGHHVRASIAQSKSNTRLARAIFMQKLVRRFLAMKSYQEMRYVSITAVVRIQSLYRSHCARHQYLNIIEQRLDALAMMGGSGALRPNERIVMTGLVAKESNWSIIGKQKRVLILTSCNMPRLFYINPDKKEVRGIIDLNDKVSAICADDDRKFEVTTERRVYKFHLMTGAARWTDAILDACDEYCSYEANSENVAAAGAFTRNRGFSITSIPAHSPTKINNRAISMAASKDSFTSPTKAYMGPTPTPNKATATFLATVGRTSTTKQRSERISAGAPQRISALASTTSSPGRSPTFFR